MNLTFSIIQTAYAHEKGATTMTVENTLGPLLAFMIIILAVVVAKYIKRGGENKYDKK